MIPFISALQAETLAIVLPRLHLLAPAPMIEVPLHCREQSVVEAVPRLPSELAADFRRVDGVPAIVPWPIAHERLECPIAWRPPRRGLQGRVGRGRTNALDRVTEPIDDREIGPLVAAADIVLFAGAALVEHQQQTRAVILDVQP